jgi:alcohol dehydrogenase (cytochrome c)
MRLPITKTDQTQHAEPISILIVDDDRSVRHAIRVSLTARGFIVAAASSGDEALSALRGSPIQLVLLDINMPGMSGVETCRRIRTKLPRAGILMFTVLDSEESKIEALEAGADDYITKPFHLHELVARLRAVARRTYVEPAQPKYVLRAGDVEINLERRTLTKAGEPIHVTTTEFNLLAYLMERREIPVAHSTLLQAVWGPEYGNELEYLRTYISTLRRKIEDNPAEPKYLITEPWLGYRFRDPSSQVALSSQVTFERLVNAIEEPQNWLTYSGNLMGQRYSPLNEVNSGNVKNLELKWLFQARSLERFEATPLVVDGIMYTVQAPNDMVAIDPVSGHVFWTFSYAPSPASRPGCGRVNRGLAVVGDMLFMGTIDSHLIAVAKSGRPLWNTVVAAQEAGCAITRAPLVVKDKVIVGVGGDFGHRGFIAAYDFKTGKEVWRFDTIPESGEPGHDTAEGESWKTGGASGGMTGSYDPALNLTYWGIAYAEPDGNDDGRNGDNLCRDLVVALDADTGKLKWHYQFPPYNDFDYSAAQVPVLVDIRWQGRSRSAMLWANSNGSVCVLDRVTGQLLLGKPSLDVTCAGCLDEKDRPTRIAGNALAPEGNVLFRSNHGGTSLYSPSFSPRTGLFYIPSWVNQSQAEGASKVKIRKKAQRYGTIRAFDPRTGDRRWEFKMNDVTDAGVLTTGSDLLFSGSREGYFYALDARNGELLWRANVGGAVTSDPMSYAVGDTQYIAISAGSSLFVYALRD